MRARYYDPEVGRFISEDPIGFQGGEVNLCAYVGNNPVNLVDPQGKLIPILLTVAAAAIGVGVPAYALWSWYKSPEYQNALKKSEALSNLDNKKNVTIEETINAYEEYRDSLGPALEKGKLTIELLEATTPWEQTIGPKIKGPSPKKRCE
jgi:uncharacterized protein RhaS with RHS repeats